MGESSSPMNGGDGKYSYTNNSTVQRAAASGVKDVINDAIIENLDMEKLLCGSKTFVIADLGCSVGPNTFNATQSLIEAVETLSTSHEHSRNLEFHVLFNDQIANDFNTLFASLPHSRNYFAAAVPGSFYGRLFPSSSIHIAYSAHALHWLSKMPEKSSPAWNPGKIHYTGASDAVVKAYAHQFETDMEIFLRARAQEIAPGGMIVILMVGVADRAITHNACLMINFVESILMDMVKEGVVEQELVDSFNIPCLYPCIEDIKTIVEKNGSFEIVKSEIRDFMPKHEDGDVDPEIAIMHFRAASEGIIANHFGNETVNHLFTRAMQQKLKCSHILQSSGIEASCQLFVVLKRKH